MASFSPCPAHPADGQCQIGVGNAVGIKAEDVGVLDIGLVHGDLGHADPVLLAGADAHGAAVLDIEYRVGGDAVLHGPAEDHVVDLPLAGVALAAIFPALPGGDRRFQVGRGADGVDGRLLDDDAAVNQALEIDKAEFFKVGQAIDAGDLDDPQVLAFFQDLEAALVQNPGRRPPPDSSRPAVRRYPCHRRGS